MPMTATAVARALSAIMRTIADDSVRDTMGAATASTITGTTSRNGHGPVPSRS